ncbi:MAG: single-stranded-DNA-specific exonuclease RecJ, partial [Chloroflexota bacterium]
FQRPAVVIRQGKDISRGSSRSIPSFDLIAALGECAPLLEEFGGHPQAAGFVVSNANLDAMHQTLVERANRVLEGLDPRPQLIIDTQLSPSTSKADVYQMCQKLAPFGVGNLEPAFLSSGVRLVEAQCVGNGGDHLRLKLNEGGMAWSGIGFGLGQRYAELTPVLDLVYQLVVDSWAGAEKLELRMLDFRPAS